MHEKVKPTHTVTVINSTRGVEVFSSIKQGHFQTERSDGHYEDFNSAKRSMRRLENGWMFLESLQLVTFMMASLAGVKSLASDLDPSLAPVLTAAFTGIAAMSMYLALQTGKDREINQHEIVAIEQANLYKRPQYDQEFEI